MPITLGLGPAMIYGTMAHFRTPQHFSRTYGTY